MLTIRNVSTVFVCRVSLQRAWNRRFCWCCGIACARALPPRRKNQHGCYLQHLSFFSCFGFDTFDFLFVVSTIIRCIVWSSFLALLISKFSFFCCFVCFPLAWWLLLFACTFLLCAQAIHLFFTLVSFLGYSFWFIWVFFLPKTIHVLSFTFIFVYIFFSLNFARAFHIQDLNMLSMKRQSKVPFIGVSCSLFIVRRIMCRSTYALKFGRKTTSSDVSLHDDIFSNTIQRWHKHSHNPRAIL